MKKQLSKVREINEAVWANINGRNNGVYCCLVDGTVQRINRARTVHGQLQVHNLSDQWVVPTQVYQA